MIPRITEVIVITHKGLIQTHMAVFGPQEEVPERDLPTGTLAIVVGRGLIWWNGKAWTMYGMKFSVGEPTI